MDQPESSGALLDRLLLGAGVALAATNFVVASTVRPGIRAELANGPTEFARVFSAHVHLGDVVILPLFAATLILGLIVLIREGIGGSQRGRLRLAAIVFLFLTIFVGVLATDPLETQIAAAAATATASATPTGSGAVGGLSDLPDLVACWVRWQWVGVFLTIVVGASLVVAHRAPKPALDEGEDALTPRHRTLLFLLGTATLFEGYDRFIVSLALPYIGKDLGAGEASLGWALSAIRFGALGSIVLGRLADRRGRRGVLLLTVLGYTVMTAVTGLSRGIDDFVLFQLLATIFLVSELALAQVVIAEEFPASRRGMGQGLLGAFVALGGGIAAVLFPIFQNTELGWRGLYFVGILPLLLIAWLRRSLPETTRWQQSLEENAAKAVQGELWRAPHGMRLGVLVGLAFAAAAAGASALGFVSFRATHAFGWTPAQVSGMLLSAGGIGFSGWFVFGRVADLFGRRATGALGLVLLAAGIALFFRTEHLFPAIAAMVFAEAAVQIAINSLGTELFPTRLRATAKSWITNAGIIGAMCGLATVGELAEQLGGAEIVVSWLAVLPFAAAPALYLLPESTGRTLEQLADD